MTRVAIIGNAGGGKSTLARKLSAAHGLPYHAVDALQWRPGWTPVSLDEVRRVHDKILAHDAWVIDGWGPWDAIEKRFDRADTLILVDLPLWVHYWWAAERQIASAAGRVLPDEPEGCSYDGMTGRLFKLIWDIHHEVRPRLLEMVAARRDHKTVFLLQSPEELDAFASEYCAPRPRSP
jgi:adenylate kinase family enzyme